MNVNILITERQKRLLINESVGNRIADSVKEGYDFTKKMLDEVKGITKMNLEFLMTYGSAIGGFMGPIDDWVSGKYPELSDIELSLVLTAIVVTIFLDNKKTLNVFMDILGDKELTNIYFEGLKKSEELKKAFVGFMSSLNITFNKISNMLAYSFLIPVLPIFYQMSREEFTIQEIKQIVIRVTSFGLLTVSSIILREIINKLLKRFSQK